MTFKYFLVAVLIGFIFYLLLLRRLDVLRKAVISVVVLTMLVFAIQPDWSTSVAHLVGISRGVDLLFYLSHLTLFSCCPFLKFKTWKPASRSWCASSRWTGHGRTCDAAPPRLTRRPPTPARPAPRRASHRAPPGTPSTT
jgi:hypothetical protein